MTLILDCGGVSALAGNRARLAEFRNRGHWPPQIPTVVLVEALTGDHRKDFHVNRLLQMCQIRNVTEQVSRDAALLRTRTKRAATISAVDATVAAIAAGFPDPVVLTSDPTDLTDLVEGHPSGIRIARA